MVFKPRGMQTNMERAFNTYSIRNEIESLPDMYQKALDATIGICEDLEIQNVEFLDRHFNLEELGDVKSKLEDSGITLFSLGSHAKLLVKQKDLEEKVKEARQWIEAAHTHGIPFVRFQMDSGNLPQLFPPFEDFDEEEWEEYHELIDAAIDQTRPSIDGILALVEDTGVKIAIETHGSFSSNYVYMEKFVSEFDSKFIGWAYDIGNFENDEMRFKALDVLQGQIFYLHAKAYAFDDEGRENSAKQIDFPRAAQILKDRGFEGQWSIEFEGNYNGILGTYQTNEWIKYAFAQANGEAYTMQTDFPSGKELASKYKLN